MDASPGFHDEIFNEEELPLAPTLLLTSWTEAHGRHSHEISSAHSARA